MLSDMPQPKYSYQRNTCRSHLYYTNERKECLMTQITKERWCQYQLTSLLYRTLFHLSALFLKIFKIFLKFTRKGNSVLPELPPLKSLAFHRHRFLPISFVRNCKRTITAYFILSYICFSVKSKDSRILAASWYIYSFYDRSGLREWLGQSQTIALTIYIV